ncbi:RHS repeat-associated core domain-containing protein, partial [Candidatus Omnitrophota bacterium]
MKQKYIFTVLIFITFLLVFTIANASATSMNISADGDSEIVTIRAEATFDVNPDTGLAGGTIIVNGGHITTLTESNLVWEFQVDTTGSPNGTELIYNATARPNYGPEAYDTLIIAVNNTVEATIVGHDWREDGATVTIDYDFPKSFALYGLVALYMDDASNWTAYLHGIPLSSTERTTGSLTFNLFSYQYTEGEHTIRTGLRIYSTSYGVGYANIFFPVDEQTITISFTDPESQRAEELKANVTQQTPKEKVTKEGEPINVANGNAFTTRTDISIPSPGIPLNLACTYNSQDNYDGPFGFGWHSTFDYELLEADDGTVIEVNNEGVVTLFTPNGDGTYSPSVGKYGYLTKHGDGTYTLLQKYGTQYNYTAEGNLSSIEDRNGNSLVFLYDGDGILTEVQHSNGKMLTFTANASDKIETVMDPSGNVYSYGYDTEGNLVSVTDPLGNVTTYQYDTDHNLTTKIDALGTSLYFQYDGEDRATRNWMVGGEYDVYLNFSGSGQTTAIDSLGRTTVYQYGEYGLVHTMIDALGNIESTVWDADMNKTAVTDKNGNTTSFTYDTIGNLVTTTDPIGAMTTFEYEPTFNQVIRSIDPLGSETNFEYDIYGNLNVQRDALLNQTLYTYDLNGNVIASTDANGNTTQFSYDSFGNLITTTDTLGNQTTFTYDAVGNVFSITDALGNVTTFTYDALNRQTAITYADGAIVQFAYDSLGNRTQITDAKGKHTQFNYDAYSRLADTVNGLGNATTYTYDTEGNQLSVVDANGNATQYQYDALNRVVQEITALGNTEAFTYDANGNRIAATDAKGDTITYAYDARNLFTLITYPDASTVAFTYDAAGRRTSMTDSSGVTLYAYDAIGRLISVDGPDAADTIEYLYDSVGNRIQMINQDGEVTTYTYDALNRLASITDDANNTTTYTYDVVSNVTAISYPNGVDITYTHDNRNRITLLANGSGRNEISSFAYTYDLNGMKTQSVAGDGTTITYAYDAINQLIEEKSSSYHKKRGEIIEFQNLYEYDAVGNRLSKSSYAKNKYDVTTYSYNADNELIASVDPDGQTVYQYDANGNLVESTVNGQQSTDYAYDYENRLISVVVPAEAGIQYTYDGAGKRIQSIIDGVTTNFLYDGLSVIIERDEADATIQAYVRGVGFGGGIGSLISTEVVVLVPAKGKKKPPTEELQSIYYHYDGMGNVVNISSEGGDDIKSYVYDAFGNIRSESGDVDNVYQFSTKEADTTTGLVYFGVRYYDPRIGRWITKDPMGMIDGPNLYAYVGNNPVNFVDYWGYFKFGKTKLQFLPWIVGLSSGNPFLNAVNIEVSHEQGFFEDAKGGNVGFFPEGRRYNTEDINNYELDSNSYDDATIRQALNCVEDGRWNLVGDERNVISAGLVGLLEALLRKNNCQ